MDRTKYCPLTLKEKHACYRNKYTTDDTMVLRVLRDILEQVKMDPESYLKMVNTHIFIHPQVSYELAQILENVQTPLPWTQDEQKLVAKVLSVDYNERKDVERLADWLTRNVCDEDSVRRLNKLFAVDGFVTQHNYKHYVDSLKTQLFEDTRDFTYDEFGMFVLAVRSFYKQFEKATPLMVHKAACVIMENKKPEDLTPEAAFLMSRFGNWVERVKEKVIRKKIDDELKQVLKPVSN